MRAAPLSLVVVLVGLGSTRCEAENSCGMFALNVNAADDAYADYRAYVKDGDSGETDIAYKVFSYLLDVADEYASRAYDGNLSQWISSVVRPSLRRPTSRSPCLSQLRTVCGASSNSDARSSGRRPERASSTTLCWNSDG